MATRPQSSTPDPAPSEPGRGIDWRRLHLWQIQPIRDVLMIAGVLGVLYLGYVLSLVTVPLFLAVFLAYLFEPVVGRLTRPRWMSRQGAAGAIIAATIIVVVVPASLAVTFAVVQGSALVSRFAQSTTDLRASVQVAPTEPAQDGGEPPRSPRTADAQSAYDELASPYRWLSDKLVLGRGSDLSAGMDLITEWIQSNASLLGSQAIGTGLDALRAVAGMFTSISMLVFMLFLTAFFFFFVSSNYSSVIAFAEGLVPERDRERVVGLVVQMDRVVAGFVRGRLTIALIQAVVFTILYWFVGVPAPLILGPMVAVLSIVPYLALVGIPISIALIWLEPSGMFAFENLWWWKLLAPTAIYFLGQALDDYVLTPTIQGKSTGMDTPTILFASLAGGVLAGVYGLLLAIPVAACIKILLREVFWPRFKDWAEGRERDFLPIERD